MEEETKTWLSSFPFHIYVCVAEGEPGLVGSIVSAASAATLFRKIVG
jgi:hypothetical protein